MVEWLAMPATGIDAIALDAWVEAFSNLGHAASVTPDGPGAAWIEVPAERLRGYAVIEGGFVEAINFELHQPDPSHSLAVLESVASTLGWELHQEDDDDDDDAD